MVQMSFAATFQRAPRRAPQSREMETPWGRADSRREIAPGIVEFSTPSHGGIRLDDERMTILRAEFPTFRPFAGGSWFEEDCDWSIVALAFPEHFSADHVRAAVRTARYFSRPDAYGAERWREVIAWLNSPSASRVIARIAE